MINRYINENLRLIIYIDGFCRPSSPLNIINRALSRGCAILNDNLSYKENKSGKNTWERWISRIDNDKIYSEGSNGFKSIIHEKEDISERRAYLSAFFIECERYYGRGSFDEALRALRKIYLNLEKINELAVTSENIGNRVTRDKIISVIKECSFWEKDIINNIAANLNMNFKNSESSELII